MRYAPAERLLRLALRLAGSHTGLTLEDMAAELDVSRRTAERLRDSLSAIFPKMDFEDDGDRVRRWRLPATALHGLVETRPEALAAIEAVAKELAGRGETERAELLRDTAATLRAAMRPDALRRAEPDIEALTVAEGIAMRPMPRAILAQGMLATLRRAILGTQLVRVRYAAAKTRKPATRILCPYGILYGGRGWLVAHVEGLPEMRLWRLDRIASADLLDQGFARREDFSLAAYAARSFGVFQEDPIDVVLRFTPDAAEDAAGWLFHPSQTMEPQPDGSLIVRFHAGGLQEMCWHLFTWGEAVTVIEPEALRRVFASLAATAALHHNRTK